MIGIASFVLVICCAAVMAQGQCTDREAAQQPGSWHAKNRFGDELANADRTFPKNQYALLLNKADKVIAMLKALPTPIGAEAQPIHSISGTPYVKDGPVPFGVDVPIFNYYCNPNSRSIQVGDETGTWIYFYFNSVGWLANERMVRGHTVNGAKIYQMPQQKGDLRGFALLSPELNVGNPDEAIIITADGSSPFKPLSREKFLLSEQKKYQDELDKLLKMSPPPAFGVAQRQSELAAISNLLNSLSPEEKQQQAIVNYRYGFTWGNPRSKVFVTEAQGGEPLVTLEAAPFKPAASRTAVKIITVYWRVSKSTDAESVAIRQFKENFDFQALRKMLDQ
jgi:hypothetical protein